MRKRMAWLASGALAAGSLQAGNLLVNGDFNSPASSAPPTGWTTYTSGNAWCQHVLNPDNAGSVGSMGVDGTYFMQVGVNGWYSSGLFSSVYQIVQAVPGRTYTLSVASASQNWWNPEGQARMIFLDASTNVLSTVSTQVCAWVANKPWATYYLTNDAPAGAAFVKVELANPGAGGNVWFDNASLTSSYDAPTISGIYPNGETLLQATNKLVFTAASTTTSINQSGIQVVLNGSNVSSGLAFSGGPLSYAVSYSGLASNQLYTAVITVTDVNGIHASTAVSFDTYSPTLLWEAEDFDFSGGHYINNPTLSSSAAANSYFGVIGTQSIDEYETGGNPPGSGDGPQNYRSGDPMSTDVAGDVPRANFIQAQAVDSAIKDYEVGYFYGSEWMNYTRSFPTGKYYVYVRVATGTAGAMSLDQVTSGQGTTSQSTNHLGSFQVPALGWSTYSYVPLTDTYSNLVAVSLAGVNTLRVHGANAGGNLNFFFVIPANTSAPIITNLYPNGNVLFQPTNKFAFRVLSPVGFSINTNNIQLSLNGVNVSTSLVATGTATSWNVVFSGLKTNTAYAAQVSVTDANGNATAVTVNFDTYNPAFVWEGEDWDFNNGQFIDNPVLSSSSQANSYFGQSAQQGVDENTWDNNGDTIASTAAQHAYRSGDAMGIGPALDTPRQNFLTAQAGDPGIEDYMLGWLVGGEWVNYTRTFPAGKYNLYVRAGYGNGGTSSLYLDQVTAGQGASAQGIAHVGSFTIPSLGWTTYSYVPCVDAFGNLAEVNLNGRATFRLTAGSANVNFFMLVPARTDLPRVANVYPDGATVLQGTNLFAFTVQAASNPSITVNTNNVTLTLNGASAPLSFTASGPNWLVTTPLLSSVPSYAALLHVADAAGNSVSSTIYFDTFKPNNFVWEAEDYDYNGGQFFDNPVPTSAPAANSYFGLNGEQGVDYDYVTAQGSAFYLYRADDFIATDITSDTPLRKYVAAELADPAIKDYNLAWWSAGSWINYTRTYPAGRFNVYGRIAGAVNAAYSVSLGTVSGGAATTVGTFSRTGRGYGSYDWVPLTQNGTNAVLALGGVSTLRVTTDGQVNANRYLLVPISGDAVYVTAAVSGGTLQLKFPTATGYTYGIVCKNNLSDAVWQPLASYAGDGTVQTHSVGSLTGNSRFYRVVTQ